MKTKTSSSKRVPTPFSLRQSASRSFPLAPTLVAAALMALCPLQQTRADTIALSFTGGVPHDVGDFTATVGWAFHLDGPVAVTQLGLWDEGNDGFITDHLMGIC